MIHKFLNLKIYVIFDKKFSQIPSYIGYKNVSEKAFVGYYPQRKN